jgi:hypothetical protein
MFTLPDRIQAVEIWTWNSVPFACHPEQRARSPWRPGEESKDPYIAHSFSPGTFFEAANATSPKAVLPDIGASGIFSVNLEAQVIPGAFLHGEMLSKLFNAR